MNSSYVLFLWSVSDSNDQKIQFGTTSDDEM